MPTPLELREKLQLFALAIYILCLLACTTCWIVDDFTTAADKVVSVVPESGKMFIGVVLAYLAAVLANNKP